ncbi:MAG: hypothetical protein KAJ19_08865, partial [Gammaproteobacteria bacterium]|nr:hypothetical protein [Gammaproteobacteria bacterium]
GPNVTLSDANAEQPSFPAPDVAVPTVLTFQLTVDDGTDNAVDSVDITVQEGLSKVTVSGKLFYELPTRNNDFCRGYNFTLGEVPELPVRRARVQLLDSVNTVLATTKTLDDGSYSFANIAASTNVKVRVFAELIETGTPSWNVEVRDNTSDILQPLDARPIYAVQWELFNTGVTHTTGKDFVARTGWDGSSYTGPRAAAPLAILDSLLDAIILVSTEDPSVDMGQLDAFWSINNSWTGNRNFQTGELPTTFYTSDPDFDTSPGRNPSLFLLGDAIGRFAESTIDTDEFDRGVILHEWGHFFEDELSRSDSIGGTHFIPGTVEPRVSFGEGWGYGIAAIANGDPILCDTGSPATSGFALNIETWLGYGTHGFFNEMSVAAFLYDLWDTSNDVAADIGSIGFAPIYNTMVGSQANTAAFTSLFSFSTELRASLASAADQTLVDSLLNRENVDTGALEIWGGGQTTLPVGWRDILPVYTELPTDGRQISLCANSDQVIEQNGNKPGEWRYLRFTTTNSSRWRVIAAANPVPPATNDIPDPDPDAPPIADRSDPDLWL